MDDHPDEDEQLDPQAAATLLASTERHARHELDTQSAAVLAMAAVVVLAAYGAIWVSVRHQHPYAGPSLGVIGFVYALVVVCAIAGSVVYGRARAGVLGRSRHEDHVAAIPLVAGIVAVYAFVGAMKYDGFGAALTYGVVDAAAPWIVVGAVLAGQAATREDWWKLGGAIGVMAAGAAAAFAGPNGVWGVLALCGFVGLAGAAALRVVRSRRT